MIITISSVTEIIIIGILYLINITLIQKILMNYSQNKSNIVLAFIFITSGAISLIFKNTEHIVASFVCSVIFYLLIFVIQIKSSAGSKKKSIYITAIYLIIDSIIQSLLAITVGLITNDFNKSIVINTASVILGIIAYIFLKKAALIGNQIRNSVNLISKQIYFLIFLALFFYR